MMEEAFVNGFICGGAAIAIIVVVTIWIFSK